MAEIKNKLGSWLWPSSENSTEVGIQEMSCPDINRVQSLLAELQMQQEMGHIERPQLVVVGTQSSGKSSVLNSLIQWDILPTGQNMVTRTPLQIELIPVTDSTTSILQFGEYQGGHWQSKRQFTLSDQPSAEELGFIHSVIESETIRLAGKKKEISPRPIYVQIHSPRVPQLTLVDLPGLTMVACTDQGQPADIKQQISDMISGYLTSSRTLIMAIMPARCDLEADAALELIKRHDPHGDRSVGILTKVDLMNTGTDISEYLQNKMSKDLAMKYGYFGVRNRTRDEMKTHSLVSGLALEQQYFQQHPKYRYLSSQTGIRSVRKKISYIYQEHIQKCLPEVLKEVEQRLEQLEPELTNLGTSVPTGLEPGHNFLYSILTDVLNHFRQGLLERKDRYHMGRDIKKHLVGFRSEIRKMQPFTASNFPDKSLIEVLEKCEGNQMSVPIPTIEVLENCLCHPQHRPFQKILPITQSLVGILEKALVCLIQEIVDGELQRYPVLKEWIITEITRHIIHPCAQKCCQIIEDWVRMEEHYIWTEDQDFREQLSGVHQQSEQSKKTSLLDTLRSVPNSITDTTPLRTLLQSYYNCFLEAGSHHVPKIIMYHLIHGSIRKQNLLFRQLEQFTANNSTASTQSTNDSQIHPLLVEPAEVGSRREKIEREVTYLRRVKSSLYTPSHS